MNDLEREIRETLHRHEPDAPTFDASDARRTADRTRRRQIANVAGVGVGTLVVAVVLVAGLGGLIRADRTPTMLDTPSPSQSSAPTPGPTDQAIHGWPSGHRNPAGVYSWGKPYSGFERVSLPDGSHEMKRVVSRSRFMHNGYKPGSGDVVIIIDGDPGRLIPHRGKTAVTVAGYEGTYRRTRVRARSLALSWAGLPLEEWMVDIQGTTVTIRLIEEPKARDSELAEAHEIIRSMYVAPCREAHAPSCPAANQTDHAAEDDELGFRLIFTLTTNTWDSG